MTPPSDPNASLAAMLASDAIACAIGEALIHEAVQRMASARIGVCEVVVLTRSGARRCRGYGVLRGTVETAPTIMCPRCERALIAKRSG